MRRRAYLAFLFVIICVFYAVGHLATGAGGRVPAFNAAPPGRQAARNPKQGSTLGRKYPVSLPNPCVRVSVQDRAVLYQQPCYCYCDRMGTKVCIVVSKIRTAPSARFA